MKRLRPTVWLAVLALLAPGLVAALPACAVADHCAMDAMAAMEAMPPADGSDCHGPTIGDGDCCVDKAPEGAPVERLGTPPEALGALAAEAQASTRPVTAPAAPPRSGEGLSPPLATRFQALLL